MGQSNKELKKPQNQMYESCRKAWMKILHNKNKLITYSLSHIFDSGVCYFTQEVINKKIIKKLLVWNFVPFHSSYCINFERNIVKKTLDDLNHK